MRYINKKKFGRTRSIASLLCANIMLFGIPALSSASEITGVTPNGNTYNIEASKVSGSTGFREYQKFSLSEGDIANLVYKENYSKFVNLVDNQVVINGIVNTMKDNNFYNGHAIFVSPNGIVVGASGILNVGSLTLMAPSQNAYDLFKKNYANNLKNYEFDLSKNNYKSLITNSSGDIILNGKIFAREGVNAYGRQILTNVDPEDVTKSANASPKIVAGIQDKNDVITKADQAETLFNSIVSNDTTNAASYGLKDGKIILITHKANEEILTSDIDNKVTVHHVDSGLKIVKETKAKDSSSGKDSSDGKNETETTTTKTIDTDTYKESSLSSNDSVISIKDTTIVANNVEIEAQSESKKEITEDTIKDYNEALKASQKDNSTNTNDKEQNAGNNNPDTVKSKLLAAANANAGDNIETDANIDGNKDSNAGSGDNAETNKDGSGDKTTEDKTTGSLIHKSFKDVAPSASAKITIDNSKIYGDKISITSEASSSTETYIQLMDTIYEKWIAMVGTDILAEILLKINEKDLPKDHEGYDWQSWSAVKSFFSDDPYQFFDGARASSNINITDSVISAVNSVDITSDASSKLKISTGTLDSSPAFMYGLGSSTESKVNIKNSTLKTSAEDGEININALSTLSEKLRYDGTKFLSLFEQKNSESDNSNIKPNGEDTDNSKPDSSNSENNSNSNNNSTPDNSDNNDSGSGKSKLLTAANTNADVDINKDSKDGSGDGSETNKDKTDGNSTNPDTTSQDDNKQNSSDKDNKDGESSQKNKVSAYNLVLLNNTVTSDTDVTIDNSNVETTNLNVRAISYNETDVSLKNVSNVGKDSDHTGVSAGMLINHFRANTNIDVKNNSKITLKEKDAVTETKTKDDGTEEKITTTYGNARFITQNVNSINNSVESEVKAKEQTNTNTKVDFTDTEKGIISKSYNFLNDKLFSKIGDKVSNVADKLNTQFSGSGIWNDEINKSVTTIDNSAINATTVDVASNLTELTINQAKANAGANNKFGAGAAVIVDDQHNTSNAKITNNAQITAKDDITVNATTQLPMNPMELKIGQEVGEGDKAKDLYLGVGFDQGDGIDKWDAEFLHTKLLELLDPDTLKSIGSALKKPKEFAGSNELSMEGLFNNFAKAEGSAETAAIAGSVVVNTLKNDTIAEVINGAILKVTGDEGSVNINAANSVINYNAVGKADFLIEEINKYIAKLKPDDEDAEEASKFGLGGSVLVSNLDSNATAKIDNSKVNVESGDINVNSAQEEGYINALVTGGSAGTFVIEGSVNIQNIGGKTSAYIVNSNDIKANSVNVNAGKASIEMKQSGEDDPFEFDDDTHELNVKDSRDFDDKTLVINILGVNATQKGSSTNSNQNASSGASVGASVNVASVQKEKEAYIDNSTITADEVKVDADTISRKIDVLLAAASAGGVDMKEAKEEGKKSNEEKAKSGEGDSSSNKPADSNADSSTNKPADGSANSSANTKKSKNIGNWMDMLDEAGDDEEDVMNLNDLFKENDASEQAQTSVKKESTTGAIKTADKTADKDGKLQNAKNENAQKDDKSNTETLTDNKNKKLEGDSSQKADTTTASNNFSLAAAGSIDITKDETKITSKITNSTINAGKKAEVSSNNNTLVVDVNGGFAKAGNVAVGAGVNVYRNLSKTKSLVENSKINFTDKNAEGLDVKSNFDADLVDVTVGIGAAKGSDSGAKIAVGGSFAWNTLKNEVSSKINKSTVQKEENAGNPDINVSATDDSLIWNITGGVAYAGSSKDKNASENEQKNATGVGAGIAATVDYSSKNINAEITDSTLTEVKDVKVNADLKQNFHTIAVAAAVATTKSAYTFDGAVNTEINTNTVNARVGQGYTYDDKGNVVKDKDGNIVKTGVGTTIKSTGDVEVSAVETIQNLSIAGGVNFSSADSGVGVGIGAVVNVNNSDVTAEADKLTVEKSGSIKINAKEDEDLSFLAVNFGLQTGGGHAINVNGIANVFLSDVVSQAINNSVLNSSGDVAIQSLYFNNLWGVTAAVAASKDGAAASANLIADVYNNHITSLLEKGSKINTDGDVTVKSIAVEEMTIFPVGVSISGNSAAVAANINANVIVDTIKAQVFGEISKSGSVLVKAQDTTSILTRGGTLALTFGNAAIGGDVNVDVINKNVTAEIKDTNVNSSGSVEVLAKSINAMGGTKNVDTNIKDKDLQRENYTYSVGTLDKAKEFTNESGKDSEGKSKYENDDKFGDWNMFYDLGVSSKAAVSGVIVVKVIDDTVKSYVTDSNINADSLSVNSISGTVANAIMGRINVGGTAAVGANVFVMSGTSTVEAQITDDYNSNGKNSINIADNTAVQANSEKKSTLITVGGGAAGTASVNGAAVANVINDTVTSKIGDGVNVNTGSLDVIANSDNDLKGLVVNVGAAGTAAVGAVVYVNKQNTTNTAKIGELGKAPAIIKAINDINVKANADDEFSALLVNVAASGTASVAGTALVNVIDSDVISGIYNSNILSEQGKVDVIADRGYNRDEILNENKVRSWFKSTNAYNQKQQANSDNKAKDISQKDIDNLKPKVGMVSASASGTAAVTASVIVNDMEGNITSEVKESEVSTKDGLNVEANQTFTNYDAIAAMSVAGNAAVNAVGVINVLEDNVTAQLDKATVKQGGANVDAASQMKINQLVVSGQVALTGASVGAAVDVNKLNDKVHSYVTNGSEIHDGTTVNAEHSVEINNVLLGATIAGTGAAVNIVPVINSYTGETIAEINGNSIVNDGAVTINAFDNIDNFSAIAGIGGAGVGANVSGYLIKNSYENTVNAGINGLNIDTNNNINISSASVLDSENALLAAGIAGVGASVTANVIVNDIESHINSYIDNSVVNNAGEITLTANKKKDGTLYQDKIYNLTGSVGVTGIGANASTNMIFNLYNNTTQSYVQNTNLEHAPKLAVEAHGDKKFTAKNYGVSAAGMGGAVIADAVVDQIESTTHAFVKANNNKNINVDGAINVIADDKLVSTSDMGFAAAAGAGGAAGANINISNYNEAVIAELLSEGDSKITAESVDLASNATYALKNTISGAAVGFGAMAGDVSIVRLGKREALNENDGNKTGINESLNTVKEGYDKAANHEVQNKDNDAKNLNNDSLKATDAERAKAEKEKAKFNPTSSSSDGTGSIARINGNVEAKGDITLNAKTDVKGIKEVDKDGNVTLSDTLAFENLKVLGGGVAAGVGVKLIDFSNQTNAEITGGTVTTQGDININSESKNDVKITNKSYKVSGASIEGAVAIYDNKSYTNSKIANADIAAKNINLNAKSSNKANMDSESVTVSGLSIAASVSKAKDDSTTNAIVTGNTNITTKAVEGNDSSGKLNIHATGDSDMKTNLQSHTLAPVDIAYMDGEARANSKTNAVIKDVNGNINVAGLNFVSDSNGLNSTATSNATSISGIKVNVTGTGSNMTATMQAGIDSAGKGLVINNSGKTSIVSGVDASDNTKGANVSANAYIENRGFSLVGGGGVEAKAVNDVTVNSVMKSNEHNAESLEMIAKVNETAKADVSNTSLGLVNISVTKLTTDAKGNVGVNVEGKNTIKNKANIDVDSNVTSDASVASAAYGFATGSGTHLTSNLESNTTLNVGGELNAKELEIDSNTERISKVDYSSSSGGAVAIGGATVKNDVSGKSEVNLVNYTPSADYDNKITIKNASTNTQDTVSSSVSGGAAAVDFANVSGSLNSTTVTNIKDSDIKTKNDIYIQADNMNIVKDSASMTNGGIVAIASNNVSHTYNSGAKISVDNSKISAKDVIAKSFSTIKNALGKEWVEYRGASKGFIAKNSTDLKNTLKQTSEIELKNNTEINADNDIQLVVNTDSNFKQKIDSSGSGFVAIPKATTTLNAENTNKISIDKNSSVSARKSAIFDFDSSNTLYTRTYANASHFAGDPTAKSYLVLTINNALNNEGTVKAGSLVGVNFMNSSNNDLSQYARTEVDAAVATSTQDGALSRTYNNLISVASDAQINSKKDIDIAYNVGDEKVASEISYRSTSYGLLGIPITVRGSRQAISRNFSNKLVLDGEMSAGDGNNKYMKITSDGMIDLSTLKGFDSDGYKISENVDASGEDLKSHTIKILEARIAEINNQIKELDKNINQQTKSIAAIEEAITDIDDMKTELTQYIHKSSDEFEKIGNDEYKALVKQALIDNNAGSVDYETITKEYIDYVKDIRAKIEQEKDKFYTDGITPTITEADIMTMDQFIKSKDTDTYKNLTEAQIKIFTDNLEIIENKLSQTPKGKYNVYDGKYILVSTITLPDETAPSGTKTITESEALVWVDTLLNEVLNKLKKERQVNEKEKDLLTKNSSTQTDNLELIKLSKESDINAPYYIEFADMSSEASGIYISGDINDADDITGSGKFNVDSPALTVDNYSTRSIILNSVMFGDGTHNGLVINGKGYSDYLNVKDKVIGSNSGVHYVSDGIGGNGDIKITNYYDVLNPFAKTLDIPNNVQESDITMQRPILTSGKLDIYNESGDITALSGLNSGSKHIVAPNGTIYIMTDGKFFMDNKDVLFAGNLIRLTANDADVKGNISAGYKERKLEITKDMLENLVFDPTTGETNMINLGATPYLGDSKGNNIKAIYKDGQIYLFGIKDSIGAVTLDMQTGKVAANVSTKEGSSSIDIVNHTDKVINVSNIVNISSLGQLYKEGGADYTKINHKNWNAGINGNTVNIDSKGGINFNSAITNFGNVNITNENGNITLYKDILAYTGDINVSQTNGSIINGIVDNTIANHSSVNFADNAELLVKGIYVPNLTTSQDLIINVVDGDIGVNSNPNAKVGIDATTRDFTDSINVNIGGNVTATAKNNTNSDKRVINLRAKDSNLNIKDINSDGDVILTAADWDIEDMRPTPDDSTYFEGHSILNTSENNSPIKGQNISLIASDKIGTPDKKIVINQDTLTNNGAKFALEAENDVYIDLKSNSDNPTYIDALISKRGNIDFTNSTNSSINQITSGGDLHILETGKDLTIYNIGGNALGFDDILYPHDDISMAGENAAVPQSIEIEVLDANGGDNAESTLKIYSAYVKGRNNGEGAFDENGRQIADVSLMADNIYVNSANAKSSPVETLKNGNGYSPSDNTYTDAQLGLNGDNVYEAQGLNSYGTGKPIVLDIKGVSKEFVEENTTTATRTNYNVQTPVEQEQKFVNPDNQITDHDYRTNNTVISVNNNNSQDRGVVLNTIYANDAYVDTKNSNLVVKDGYIKDYAEFSNADKKITVDNDFRRRLRDADTQLYTGKTGSFALNMDGSINMKTTAPAVGNDFDMLANGYQSEGNFVNRSRKDSKELIDNINKYNQLIKQNYQEETKRISVRFDTSQDNELKSNFKIYDLSTTGALIKNDANLHIGDMTSIRIVFDDIDVTLNSKVISTSGDRVGIEFIDVPPDIANRILYRYLQKKSTMMLSKQ